MADIVSETARSAMMSGIRSKGNRATEICMVALFRRHEIIGWRRHDKRVFGTPDFVFRSQRVAVFVDGCFWHRHKNCDLAYIPKSGRRGIEFWLRKFDANINRDRKVTRCLRNRGWKVLRVWQCQLHRSNWSKIARRVRLARKTQQRQIIPTRASPKTPRR